MNMKRAMDELAAIAVQSGVKVAVLGRVPR